MSAAAVRSVWPRDVRPAAPSLPAGDALHAGGDVDAVGGVDVGRAAVLASWARTDRAREALELAAHAASQLLLAPRLDEDDDSLPREAVVVSPSAVHAFARCVRRPVRAIAGIARGGGNAALLLASVRELARSFGEAEP